jgi:hypothetical protein
MRVRLACKRSWLVAGAMLVAACGSAAPATYDAAHTASAMKASGWTARSTAGMPDTYTGAKQVGYLETVAPDGAMIDLQFLASPSQASAEYTAAHQHGYNGAAVGNVLVVAHTTGQPVTSIDLDAVKSLLKS